MSNYGKPMEGAFALLEAFLSPGPWILIGVLIVAPWIMFALELCFGWGWEVWRWVLGALALVFVGWLIGAMK